MSSHGSIHPYLTGRQIVQTITSVNGTASTVKTINDIPHEVLCRIFSFLHFSDIFPTLPLVSKSFHSASYSARKVIVPSTPLVKSLSLSSILHRFPLLSDVSLQPSSRSFIDHQNPNLIHEIAAEFKGTKGLKSIECGSDHMLPAVLRGSPRLEALKVPLVHDWEEVGGGAGVDFDAWDGGMDEDDGDDDGMDVDVPGMTLDDDLDNVVHPQANQHIDPEMNHLNMLLGSSNTSTRRNLGAILRFGKSLKLVELEAPTFWQRRTPHRRYEDAESQVEILRLNSMTGEAIENFVEWLKVPSGGRLGCLKELKLDVD
ncbi:hypothetical protein HDV05_008232 [Chytridiales sp. JEL 0842]|nr:hypothetical protein HDV05_008232 [Chytridiales sp. JEL 0842]